MDVERRASMMLLQNLSIKKFAGVFLGFTIIFIACVIGGVFGPTIYERIDVSAFQCQNHGMMVFNSSVCGGVNIADPKAVWIGEVIRLDKFNQDLRLVAAPHSKLTTEYEGTLNLTITISGKNAGNEQWTDILVNDTHSRTISCQGFECEAFTVTYQPYIAYGMYQFKISIDGGQSFLGDVIFSFLYVNNAYTKFELWFRFSFLILNVIVLSVFVFKLRHHTHRTWTFEQKWMLVLLLGLIAYNNPFYALELITSNWFPIFLNRFLYGTFLVLLMFFWLVLFDAFRINSEKQYAFYRFYLPKLILLGSFWIIAVTVFIWDHFQRLSDPVYRSSEEMPGYLALQIIEAILMIVYITWLIGVLIYGCFASRKIPMVGVRVRFLGVFTILVIFVVIVGISVGAFGGQFNTAAEFLSYQALFNLYCFLLAIMYLPAGDPNASNSIGMVRLDSPDIVDARFELTHSDTDL